MAVVKVNGIEKTYPEGTTYLEIARDFQDQYENDAGQWKAQGA